MADCSRYLSVGCAVFQEVSGEGEFFFCEWSLWGLCCSGDYAVALDCAFGDAEVVSDLWRGVAHAGHACDGFGAFGFDFGWRGCAHSILPPILLAVLFVPPWLYSLMKAFSSGPCSGHWSMTLMAMNWPAW